MQIANFLSLADTRIDVQTTDKAALLRQLAQETAARLALPEDDLAAALRRMADWHGAPRLAISQAPGDLAARILA